jgi:hypothetical protein
MVPIPTSYSSAGPDSAHRPPHLSAPVRRSRTYELLLDGRQLSDALRLLLRTRQKSGTAELVLWFDGEELICVLGSASAAVPASGTWPASVSLDKSALTAFRKAGDGPRLTVEDGRLSIDGSVR